MTKEQYLELASTKWPELENLQLEGNFYEFEKRFEQIWIELGQAVLESHIGKVPNDHRKKKNPHPLWPSKYQQCTPFQPNGSRLQSQPIYAGTDSIAGSNGSLHTNQ